MELRTTKQSCDTLSVILLFYPPSDSSSELSTRFSASVPGRNNTCSKVDGISMALSTKVGNIIEPGLAIYANESNARDSNNKHAKCVHLSIDNSLLFS